MNGCRASIATYLVVGLSSIAAIACNDGSRERENLFPAPKDLGVMVVRVNDRASGSPVSGVPITISEIPNLEGRLYSVGQRTDAEGVATFLSIPAGTLRVGMRVPAGFAADPEGSVRQVDLIKDASVTVAFRITRQ